MNYYYDPILGLQYTAFGTFIEFDVTSLPNNLETKDFIQQWQRWSNIGFLPIYYSSVTTYSSITSNFIK